MSPEHAIAVLVTLVTAVAAGEHREKIRARQYRARRRNAGIRSRVVKWGRGQRVTGRNNNKKRTRMCWASRLQVLTSDGDIKPYLRRYKVSPRTFDLIANKIRHIVEAENISQSKRGNNGEPPILAELQLSICLRYLAGSHFLDLEDMHGVSTASVYNSIHRVAAAICKEYGHVINLPLDDIDELKKIAQEFESVSDGALVGCIGAVDGIALSVEKLDPNEEVENPMDYWNFKVQGFGVVYQVVCDAKYRVRYFSNTCTGSTNDALAWECASVYRKIKDEGLPDIFYMIGDDAYKGGGDVVTPYPGANLSHDKDAFNFYHSSSRMCIEQTFGIWKERWGVFHRPSPLRLHNFKDIVEASFILHNMVIDDPEASRINQVFRGNYEEFSDVQPGDRLEVILNDTMSAQELSDLPDNASRKRDILCKHMHEIGLFRPAHSQWGRNANLNHRR